jgi:uncharacterized membrane protein
MDFCNICYNFIINKKERLTKTITWRLIATSTTFIVGYLVQGDVKKAASIAIIDTSINTIFYYFHEAAYENMKNNKTCIYSSNIINNNYEISNINKNDDIIDNLNDDIIDNLNDDIIDNLNDNNDIKINKNIYNPVIK